MIKSRESKERAGSVDIASKEKAISRSETDKYLLGTNLEF